jgi:asparagine N-glycosylation enzyme membrane subunit Stt3
MAMLVATELDRRTTAGLSSRLSAVLTLPVLLIAVLVSIPIFVSENRTGGTQILGDPDLWWHLKNAALLLSHRSFIIRDLYSFTTLGRAWVNPEWLAEIPYYIAFHVLGDLGVFLVLLCAFEIIVIGTFLLAYLRSQNWQASFVAAGVALFLALVNFGPRTILFGWICFLAEAIILELFRRGQDYSALLIPLFVIWINLHGSWVIGFAFLLAFIGSGLLDRTWGYIEASPWNGIQRRKLLFVTLASTVGLLLNPYGWRLLLNPFDMAFHQKLNIGSIDEWKSVNFHMANGKFLFLVLASYAVLTLVRRRSWALHDVVFALMALYAGLTYVRFLFLIGLVVCPMFAIDLGYIFRSLRPQKTRPVLNALVLSALALGIYLRFPTTAVLRTGISESMPEQAIKRINTFSPKDHIFNYFGWGGYMIWTAQDRPVFIDSRTDIFEHHGVLADYLQAISLTNTFGVLNKYDIRYVFLPKNDPIIYLLRNTPGWTVNYQDGVAVIMERSAPRTRL